MANQNAPAAEEAAVKNAPPLISSAAGAKEGDAGIGLTLYANKDKTKENAPDLTGYVSENGVLTSVSGWFVAAGKADDKEYNGFVNLRATKASGGKYEELGQGKAQAMNNYKGQPVDTEHRSRVLANLTIGGREIVAAGYANKGLADSPELAAAFGFTGPVIAKGVEAPEADAPKRGPRP